MDEAEAPLLMVTTDLDDDIHYSPADGDDGAAISFLDTESVTDIRTMFSFPQTSVHRVRRSFPFDLILFIVYL